MANLRYSPTATPKERIALGASSAVALVCLLLGWLWLAALPFAAILAVVIVQQPRENRDRRAALDQLKQELPSMTEGERQGAVERFCDRFPAWAARRGLNRYLATLSAPSTPSE